MTRIGRLVVYTVIIALLLSVTGVAGRYYDARTARWTSPDPALQEGDPKQQTEKYGYKLFETSPYGYSLNNPLLYKDPDGKFPWPIFLAAAYFATEFSGDHPGGSPGLVQSTLALGSIGVAQPAAMWALRNPLTATAATTAVADALAPPGVSLSPLGPASNLISTEAKGITQAAKTGQTVLGKYPDYINFAKQLGARVFDIPMGIWDKMSDAEKWAANVKFLDRLIARGDEIILSNPVKNVNEVTGSFRKELDYLIQQGYRLSEDGTRMTK